MMDDFLRQLQAATDEKRRWLVTENLLNSLPPDLTQMAWAAAIPHWFDADILAALRPELKGRAAGLYAQLQTLPFVEPFEGRGYNVHELTRKLMLAHLWQEHREKLSPCLRARPVTLRGSSVKRHNDCKPGKKNSLAPKRLMTEMSVGRLGFKNILRLCGRSFPRPILNKSIIC